MILHFVAGFVLAVAGAFAFTAGRHIDGALCLCFVVLLIVSQVVKFLQGPQWPGLG